MSDRTQSRLPKKVEKEWVPQTELGEMVQKGEITIDQIFHENYVVKEKEIYEMLLPNLEEDVITIKMVQQMTRSGQRSRFKAVVIVGCEGYIGFGSAKNPEVGPAIRKAITKAKLNINPVLKGCGSWECDCGGDHSIPFKVSGKCGSVHITLIPSPAGVGLACADHVKSVLRLVGIEDIWSKTRGDTRTSENLVKATIDALRNAHKMILK
jgi:small subunit ribosomal protein S5